MRRERDWAGLKGLVALVAVGALVGWLAGEAWGQDAKPDRITGLLVTKHGMPREVVVYAFPVDAPEYHIRAFRGCVLVAKRIMQLAELRAEGFHAECVLDEPLADYWSGEAVSWETMDAITLTYILEQEGVK